MNDISSKTPPNALRQRRHLHTGRPDRCDRVALVLQGGGALGAYQAGVYQAMHEANITHIIYQQKAYEGHAKDYESGTSMREYWQSGNENTKRTLKRPEWLAIPSREVGVLVHDVHREHE